MERMDPVVDKVEDTELKKKIEKNRLAAIERRRRRLQEQGLAADIKRSKISSSNSYSIPDDGGSTGSAAGSSTPNKAAARIELREKTILKMKQAGIHLPSYEPGGFAKKHALSAPYHYFLTKVADSTNSEQLSVSMPELLDESLGLLVCSLHINFIIDVGWLCMQYLLAAQDPTMTLVYGDRVDESLPTPSNVDLVKIAMTRKFGCHHAKISLFMYTDNSIRVAVSTANLYSDDWENRTQGLWISPRLPQLPESSCPGDGDSPTTFKKDFRQYLAKYSHPSMSKWDDTVRRTDFTEVKVFFVASVPGAHNGSDMCSWGISKLEFILSRHAVLPADSHQWPIVAQSSSIGSLGPDADSWLLNCILKGMSQEKVRGNKRNPNIRLIYPTTKNVMSCIDVNSGRSCLAYPRVVHNKQQWLKNYLHQWKSDKNGRTNAMPHIKSYTRISPDNRRLAWFVLTSANLSKGAWGSVSTRGNSLDIRNYEAGVVFLPQFIINENSFLVADTSHLGFGFRMHYDLPLIRYDMKDEPFTID